MNADSGKYSNEWYLSEGNRYVAKANDTLKRMPRLYHDSQPDSSNASSPTRMNVAATPGTSSKRLRTASNSPRTVFPADNPRLRLQGCRNVRAARRLRAQREALGTHNDRCGGLHEKGEPGGGLQDDRAGHRAILGWRRVEDGTFPVIIAGGRRGSSPSSWPRGMRSRWKLTARLPCTKRQQICRRQKDRACRRRSACGRPAT